MIRRKTSPTPPTPRSTDRVRIVGASISKWQIKVVLTALGLGIMGLVLSYTKLIVDDLVENELRTVDLYAGLLARSAQEANDQELLFYLDRAYSSIHFPVVITDADEQPIYPYQQFLLNVSIDTTASVDVQRQQLLQLIAEMKQEYEPYEIVDPDGAVIQKIFYTNSAIVRRLRFMPFVEILVVTVFIFIGYLAFSTIRRSEESNIWVGMAKEAAHQLGTPLSSLLAWLEILRSSADNRDMVESTIGQMEEDVSRLNVIANRFSKIGSQPQRVELPLAPEIERVCRYFDTRLPNLGRRVVIERDLDPAAACMVSSDLFAWVLENLIKNATEAMDRKDGKIQIVLRPRPKGGVLILFSDNGKGMTAAERKMAFQPGYTTKRRGWGLGLSLSRRIIEEYHRGRLIIRDSQPGIGTTFQIEIP